MADTSLKQLLARASLAFSGTVRAVGESPVEGIEPDARTAVVQVEQGLHGPEQVDLSPGTTVTVQLSPELPPLSPGDRATFFADALVYGDTLAVAEVGRTGTEEATVGERAAGGEMPVSPVDEALAELAQDAVLEHARTADAVVRGHVIGLSAVGREELLDEHHPHWWVATLHVDLVERGELPGVGERGGEVRVLYANSLDIRWRSWPKPKAGQAGMWMLHRTTDENAQLAPFQIMHPEDLQPSLQLDLLREGGTGGER